MKKGNEKSGNGSAGKMSAVIVLMILTVIVIMIWPVLQLKTAGMKCLRGEWIDVWYEDEREAAEDLFQYADLQVRGIAEKLGFTEKQNVSIYIYDSQKTMQSKKYGWIAPLLGLDWYIGDNIGTNVILTSPANPGKEHSYNSVREALPHEIVHAYISVINPKIALWLTEGCALYLTNGEDFRMEYLEEYGIPSYEETMTGSPLVFAKCNGYQFAHTYIEYLDRTYGWDRVMALLKTEDYEAVFGKTRREIYDEWKRYLEDGEM